MDKAQRRALLAAVTERRNWLHRLHMRMRSQKWHEECPTYRAALNAYEAMHKLMKTLDIDPAETQPASWMKHIGRG